MYRPLVYYFIAVIIGVVFSSFLVNDIFIGAVIAASFLLTIFFTVNRKLFIVTVLFFILGCISFSTYFSTNLSNNKFHRIRILQNNFYQCIGSYSGKKVLLKGNVSKYNEGENILIKGDFSNKKIFERGVIGTISVKNAIKGKDDILKRIYDFKKELYKNFYKEIGKDKAPVLNALCFGNTEFLTTEQKENFKNLGVIHAVSVSGLHIAIVFKLFEIILGIYASLGICLLYVIFTGLTASAIRAYIMIVVLKISKKLFKKYDGISSLSFAGIFIIIFKPYYVYDIGFALSFLATLGIIIYYKKLNRQLYKLPQKLSQSLSIMLSSQIFVIPYSMFTIKTISLGSIISNIVLVPIYSIVVILGNMALLFMYITPIFKIINYIIYTVFTVIEGITNLTLKITPPLVYAAKIEAIAFIIVYISFLMIRKGYKNYKYIIILCTFFIAIQNYNVFPKIEYITYKDDVGIMIKYKNKSIYLCKSKIKSYEEEQLLKRILNADKIIEIKKKEYCIRIKSNMCIKNLNSKKGMNFILNVNGKNILFTNETHLNTLFKSVMNSNKKYAIIKMPLIFNYGYESVPQKEFSYIMVMENPILVVI